VPRLMNILGLRPQSVKKNFFNIKLFKATLI
jgi:hypothetical protein